MIRYSLKCDKGHAFEGWFASAQAYDRSQAAGMVSCTLCGSTAVEKQLMAPTVQADRAPAPAAERPLSAPQSATEAALAELRRAVEANSDYVGVNFAAEARAMHDGDAPERSIWGEARPDEARALIEDGISVMPLPFLGPRKTN